jgi:signal transduction histidine kinase/ligand-binding sensor domain-containing protein
MNAPVPALPSPRLRRPLFRRLPLLFQALCCLIFGAGLARAIDPHGAITQMSHTSWRAKEGIAEVRAIAQSADGYIWVGTPEGLFRFDGISFARWQSRFGQHTAAGSVSVLCAAADGSLWIGSGDSVSRLFQGSLITYSTLGELAQGDVTSIVEDHDGTIWVGTTKGLARFQHGRWSSPGAKMGLPEGGVIVQLVDRTKSLWLTVDDPDIAGGTVLAALRPNAQRFELTAVRMGSAAVVREAPDGRLWVAEGIRSVRPFSPGTELYPSPGIALQSRTILLDRESALWIGSMGRGLYRAQTPELPGRSDPESKLPSDHFGEKEGLSSDFILCAMQDREGSVWFGTAGGLDRFRENRILSFSVAEGLIFDQQLAVAAAGGGALWTCSEQGLQRIDGDKVQALGLDWIGPGAVNSVYSLYAERSGELWVGALNGIGRIQGGARQPVEIENGLELHNVTAITRDPEGGLWLCDQLRGVCRLLNNKPRIFPAGPQLSSLAVNAAITDPAGRVWLGFQDGSLSVYQDGQFCAYSVPQSITALLCDRAGQIWIAGPGGLSRFRAGRIETLTALNGLPSTDLSGLVEDDAGYLWLAGRSSLARVLPAELDKAFADPSFRPACDVFDAGDGLRGVPRQGRPFPIATKGSDGRLWFSTTAGLAVIDPRRIHRNTVVPPVHIVRAFINGEPVEPLPGQNLPPSARDIKIEYAGLSFVNPEKVLFRCQLEGYDKGWQEAHALRQASYTRLPPGSYTFRVVACNNDGAWSEPGDTWSFIIRPAFYQTTWFYSLAAAGLGLMFWGAYRWQVARVTALAEAHMNTRLEAQLAERKRIAQELHDTLLQGVTGVRLKLWAIAHQMPESLGGLREQLTQVIRQTEQCLAESRNSVWALRSPRLEEAEGLPGALSAAIRQQVAGTKLRLNFLVEGAPRKLSGIAEYNLLRICEEAVANVLKHARASRIEVRLCFEPRQAILRVEDDGGGFDATVQPGDNSRHFGLAGMRERARILGGGLEIQSRPGGPTRVVLHVPG